MPLRPGCLLTISCSILSLIDSNSNEREDSQLRHDHDVLSPSFPQPPVPRIPGCLLSGTTLEQCPQPGSSHATRPSASPCRASPSSSTSRNNPILPLDLPRKTTYSEIIGADPRQNLQIRPRTLSGYSSSTEFWRGLYAAKTLNSLALHNRQPTEKKASQNDEPTEKSCLSSSRFPS